MRARILSVVALGLASALASTATAGTAVITFVAPEGYTDGGGKGPRVSPTAAEAQNAIGSHLTALAQGKLPPNQTIKIDVLDLDLAGRKDFAAAGTDIRIFDDISPPRIKVRYALEEGGRVLLAAEETVSDPMYLNTVGRNDYRPLDRERLMLSRWFEARFVQHKAP